MRLYHTTFAIDARAILEGGFADGAEGYVWLSDVPLSGTYIKIGRGGDTTLAIDVPDDVVAAFKVLPRNGYKAYQIPAEYLNFCHKPWICQTEFEGMTRSEIVASLDARKAAEAGQPVPDNAARDFLRSERLVEALKLLDWYVRYK